MTSSERELELQLFDAASALAAPSGEALCAAHGLPVEAAPLALAQARATLMGARAALATFTPRPPIAEGEEGRLGELIATLVEASVAEGLAPLVEARDKRRIRAGNELLAWNRQRQATRDAQRPSKQAQEAMRDRGAARGHEMTRIDHGDGTFHVEYEVRPRRD